MSNLRIISGVADHLMVRLPDWSNAITLTLYGITLLQPGATFTTASYVVMARLMGENSWGALLLCLGGVRLLILVLDGTFLALAPYSLRCRAAAAAASAAVWAVLATLLHLGNPLSVGSKTYAALCAVDLIIAWYLTRQFDRQRKVWWLSDMVAGRVPPMEGN